MLPLRPLPYCLLILVVLAGLSAACTGGTPATDAGDGATDGVTGHANGCTSGACLPTEEGLTCQAAGATCIYGDSCVCDNGNWQCPPCTTQGSLCPGPQPTSDTNCTPHGTSCSYPPTPAANGTQCICNNLTSGSPYTWSCGANATFCTLLPPSDGSSCNATTGVTNQCSYSGTGWQLGCSCYTVSGWACELTTDTAPSNGAACPGVPHGYRNVVFMSTVSEWDSCVCSGSTNATWTCTSLLCPTYSPSDSDPCPGEDGIVCTYPSDDAGGMPGCADCCCRGTAWQCPC